MHQLHQVDLGILFWLELGDVLVVIRVVVLDVIVDVKLELLEPSIGADRALGRSAPASALLPLGCA